MIAQIPGLWMSLKSNPLTIPSNRSAVKRVLRRNEVDGDDMQAVQEEIMEQAESLYGDWPD